MDLEYTLMDFATERPMRTKLGVALLGTTLGGVTFLISGLAVSLIIGQLQQRVIEARGPTPEASAVQYAQLPPQR